MQGDSGYDPKFGDPASLEQLRDIQDSIGLVFPDELAELYASVDGYGLEMGAGSLLSPWFLVPSSLLPDFVQNNRSVFSGTHPEFAKRYLPCIDWLNGNSMGFIYATDGELVSGLHEFSHEAYSYEPDQDPAEFFEAFDGTLSDFFD
ncbi:hypothetical protein Enr13x_09140 [Stieleria neptunia]|uniref:SMI1 / KNR4 family protein n=2 Tax=Stieleria neptunia TaxID=2527979 RepID=A0A518HJP6_9BACT|nr:hypothetical protein Enr13x_09140 [Stieleria neptunia]